MALVFMEGFDLRNGIGFNGWSNGGNGPVSYVAGSLGGYQLYFRTGSPTSENTKTLTKTWNPGTDYAEVVMGFRHLSSSAGTNYLYIQNGVGSVGFCTIRLNTGTGVIEVWNAANNALVASGWRNIVYTGYHYIEIRCKVAGASSEVEVRVDGSPEIATTVYNFGSTNIGRWYWYFNSGGTIGAYIDDLYVVDTTGGAPTNTFLGDCRVETLLPTSDGANTAWTPNSGVTEYTQIDEDSYDVDTTYISDSIPGDKSTFGFSDLSFASGTVYGVQANLMARKDDAGLRQIRPVIRQGGVNYSVGDIDTLSTSYDNYRSLLPLDPTSAVWTPANVNANEYGLELVT